MMMSAPTVKPALPTSGAQAPPATTNNPPTSAGGSPSKPVGLGAASPPSINHASTAAMPLPLSLVQEHKTSNVGVNQQQGVMPRPMERKEFPFAPNPAIKPTSNGVEGSPTKLSPVAPHIPPELKKVEEESLSLTLPNHSVEPVKPATPTPQPTQLVAPPAPPPVLVVPAAPVAPVVAKQDVVSSALTAVNAISADVVDKSEVGTTKVQPEVVAVSQQASPTVATHPIPTPQITVDVPVKPIPVEVVKIRTEAAPKPEFKVATPPRNSKRKKEVKVVSESKALSDDDERKPKRVRTRTQPYQSPIPELTYMAKLKTLMKSPDDKLIVFYKNEFLAVRNSEGSFYVCQTMQNIYKSSLRIRIRWLSQDKKDNKTSDVYIPDFYDTTDFDCILTNLELKKLDKNKFQLPGVERERTQNILKRALDVEKGVSEKSPVTEEHPDGLDLSLYRDESQLKKRRSLKKGGKKRAAIKNAAESEDSEEDESEEESSDESVNDDLKKPIKLNIKRVEKPKTPAKPPPKEPEKRVDQTVEREKRGSTSKRRSEPVSAAVVVPDKKAKLPAKPVKKVEPTLPTRATKTRSVRTAVPAQSLLPSRTKDREVRKTASPTKGRKKSAAKKA